MANEQELLPCPFCGIALERHDDQADLYVARYGAHWEHPDNSCFLSGDEVSPSNIDGWNQRASPSLQVEGMGSFNQAEVKYFEKELRRYFGDAQVDSYLAALSQQEAKG